MITFLSLGRYGRLGNQMSQIASTIGIALKYGYDFGFPYWANYDHMERFGSKEDCDIQKWFKNPLPQVNPTKQYTDRFIHWGYHNQHIRDWTSISGHMQSDKYFDHCHAVVKHYFQFDESSQPELPVIQPNDIAVHIRLGDYDGEYHTRLGKDYYLPAMKHFSGQFWIFSDEPKKAKELLGTEHTYVEGNHYITDLYMMTKFKNHIIGNSTFSWWGSYLADSEKTIAPKKWFGHKAGLDAKDIYRQNWIVI